MTAGEDAEPVMRAPPRDLIALGEPAARKGPTTAPAVIPPPDGGPASRDRNALRERVQGAMSGRRVDRGIEDSK